MFKRHLNTLGWGWLADWRWDNSEGLLQQSRQETMVAWSSGLAKGSREERKIRGSCKVELIGLGECGYTG